MHYLGMKHKIEREENILKKILKKWRKPYVVFLDRLTFIAGIVGPFTVLPQIISIFSSQSAEGVSLTTWVSIFIVTFPWVLYGIAQKDATIITSFIMWEIANLAVVVGVLMYG